MALGEKLKQARMEAGLSQRQLCGDRLTRNMLSQIENGSAHPSVGVLGYLARRLGKPVSWFLEEETVRLPNACEMERARIALALGDLEGLQRALQDFQEPDPVFFEEKQLLKFHWCLLSGEKALQEQRLPLCRELLQEALDTEGLYITRPLRQRCRVLLRLTGGDGCPEWDDDTILAWASGAEPERCLEILGASENKKDLRWQHLAAESWFALKRYREAAQCYEKSPQNRKTWARLEECYRELEDYKRAYEYACKQREEADGQL